MAKAILEFNLDESDDVVAHFRAIKSVDMACALHEIIYNTKKRIQADIEFSLNGECSAFEAVDLVFKKLHEILDENDINIDKLIN